MTVVTPITSLEQFREIIGRDQHAVVDFWAEWCGPCKVIAPIFEKFADQFNGPNIAFYKVDVDEASDIAQEVRVTAMPTFMAFKGGDMVQKSLGADPRKLEALIQGLVDKN